MAFTDATLLSIADILKTHSFVVPEFQRGYAWGEDQWKDFWEDLKSTASRKNTQHYSGSIMITGNPEAGQVELIDGQQRMTTISLLLAALGGSGFPIEFRNNEPLQTYFDFYALKKSFLAPSLKRYQSYYSRNIANAATFFSNQARGLMEQERISLNKTLLDKFKLFVLSVQSDFDIHVAFETINNRGKPLSTLEKLKNRLIYLASFAEGTEERRAVIAEIHRCWMNVYAWLGAGKSMLDDDSFLRAHSMGWFRYERRAEWLNSQLFEENFTSHGKVPPSEILAYVRSLDQAAACWHLINEPESLPPLLARQFSALQKTANATSKPLLLWAMMRLAQENPKLVLDPGVDTDWAEPLGLLVKQAERFGTLVVLANDRQANVSQLDMNRSAYALAHSGIPIYRDNPKLIPPSSGIKAVKFAASHLASLIYNKIEKNDQDEEDYLYLDKRFEWEGEFDPQQVRQVIADRFKKGNGFYNWQLGKLIIYSWEDFLRGNVGRPEKLPWEKFAWDDSIEHIYPQKPEKDTWNDSIVLAGQSRSQARNAITNSLGNLLLLSRSRNASASNKSYDEKKIHYATGSYSEIQVARLCDKWTVAEIAARGIAMLRHAQKVWDFEAVRSDQKLVSWLPFLFGDMHERVQKGDYSFGKKIDDRVLAPRVEKLSIPN